MSVRRSRTLFTLIVITTLFATLAPAAEAGLVGDPTAYTYDTWARSDLPVSEGIESRTWMWGPAPLDLGGFENYQEAPGGERFVQYYDKARMEITYPDGDPNSIWYVTNGLLVVELITGQMQLGDNSFVQRDPAFINIAGDSDDLFGPTYSLLGDYLDDPPLPVGDIIIQSLDFGDDPTYSGYNVIAAHRDPVTNHTVAGPFWDFMNSSGTIYANGGYTSGQLFPDPLFATGRPITEAYWAIIKVAGNYTDVLLQCFERRCLTYTPANEPAWRVEAGNVGQHYKTWRYEGGPVDDVPAAGELIYGSSLTDWNTGQYDEGETFVENDSYHIYTYADNFLFQYLDFGDDPATDFWVDLDLRLVSEPNPDAYACLMTRLDPFALDYNYAFCLTSDGWTYGLYEQFNPDLIEPLLPIEQRSGATDPNQWVRLSVIHRGDQIWFLINDQMVGSTTFTGPPGGYIGFYVDNYAATPVEFEFRDLYVWAIE